MNPHVALESDPTLRVMEAVTSPDIDDRLGFSLIDTNTGFTDETTIAVLEDELTDKSLLIDRELEPVLETAHKQYDETFFSPEALSAALARWSQVYHEVTPGSDPSKNLLESIAPAQFDRFFATTLDTLPLSVSDKIMIAHVAAIIDHPGEDIASPTNHGLFEAAANYIGRKEDIVPASIQQFKGDFSSEGSFGDYAVDQVSRGLAYGAFYDLIELADPSNIEILNKRRDEINQALGLDLEKYLETIQLDWEILPPAEVETEITRLTAEAHAKGWTFDRERYLFLRLIQDATGGTMVRSECFEKARGYYLAVGAFDAEGNYCIVADNPINTESQDHAAYIAREDKITINKETEAAYTWKQVLSKDKVAARNLGAIKRKHSTNWKDNVIDSLPQDLRTKVRNLS